MKIVKKVHAAGLVENLKGQGQKQTFANNLISSKESRAKQIVYD